MTSPVGLSVRTAIPVRLLPKVKDLRMKSSAASLAIGAPENAKRITSLSPKIRFCRTDISSSTVARRIRRGVVKMTSGCFSDTDAGFWSIQPQYGNSPAERSGAAIASPVLIRQVNPPVVADLDAGRDHDFPGMVVRIAEIAGVTAVIGLVRGLQ